MIEALPIILPSAHRHGVNDDDMLHAYRNAIRMFEEENVLMYIGPARSGLPMLEIGVTVWYEIDAIIHAMPARPKYL